ncbi:MAG: sensor histidine kinase KdpD [Raoultibacter sp.]
MAESDFDTRPDPDEILRQITRDNAEDLADQGRGRLRIFFGYAAGVGKTYAMLEEAHDIEAAGCDVVVGYIEPHTRADTMALLDGLEQISSRELKHRSITLREFDLDAALARHPQVILVDELAHTNAPGSRHKKRYQDVEELLRAGIDVFTTLNVQHLEALNDKIASVTQVSVAERIPDYIFDHAVSVELIDIEPADLIERLEAGKIYLPERASTALSHFFSRRNLASLREIALRRMADRMNRNADAAGATSRPEAREDVLVYVTADPGNVRVIRAAANMAEAFHGDLTALIIDSSQSKRLDARGRARLRENVELAEELGAHAVTLYGDDVASQISQYVATAGISQVVIGSSAAKQRRRIFGDALVNRLTRLTYGSVINVVPVDDLPAQIKQWRRTSAFKVTSGDVLKAIVAVAVSTAIGMLFFQVGFSSAIILMLYMLIVVLLATRAEGFSYSVLASLGSMFAYNFFFTVPRFTFHAYGLNYPFIFLFFLLATLVASSLTVRMKRQTESIARRAYRTEVLLESSRKLQSARDREGCFRGAAEQIIKLLDRPVVMYQCTPRGNLMQPEVFDVPGTGGGDATSADLRSPDEQAVAAWAATNSSRAGATTDTLSQARCLYLPIRGKDTVFGVAGLVMERQNDDFGAFEQNLLLAIVDECGQVTEQLAFAEQRQQMELKAETEALRSNLLRTISHDLRTPLTSISGDADVLLNDEGRMGQAQRRRMYQDIYEDSSWLIALVENLLAVTRIDEGTLQIETHPELVSDVIHAALAHVNRRAEHYDIAVDLSDDLLMAQMDARLIMQVLINLVNNAITYTPQGSKIVISAERVDAAQGAIRSAHREDFCLAADGSAGEKPASKLVRIAVTDNGPGISDTDKAHIFDMFYNGATRGKSGDSRRGLGLGLALCRSIVRVHDGEIYVGDVVPHGSEFFFTLPLVEAANLVDLEETMSF